MPLRNLWPSSTSVRKVTATLFFAFCGVFVCADDANAGRDEILLCRGPLPMDLRIKGGPGPATSLGITYKKATKPVGFGLNLQRGECGWPGRAMDSVEPSRISLVQGVRWSLRYVNGRAADVTHDMVDARVGRGGADYQLVRFKIPASKTRRKATSFIVRKPGEMSKVRFRN